eukprot:jgi/Psemu1/21845/gm1.21845_g
MGVVEWTSGQHSVNIFKKKMIFIPINYHLHWSLCVLINPGAISSDPEYDGILPVILYLDSLGLERKEVEFHIEKWFNDEWNHIHADYKSLFMEVTMHRLRPTVAKQTNSNGCGVFTLMFVHAASTMISLLIEYKISIHGIHKFLEFIENLKHLKFDLKKDILRMRNEYQKFIQWTASVWQKSLKSNQGTKSGGKGKETNITATKAEVGRDGGTSMKVNDEDSGI